MVMGETTFGGLPSLDGHGTGGIMDYGSLIWIALQRTATCRAAVALIDSLVQVRPARNHENVLRRKRPFNTLVSSVIPRGLHSFTSQLNLSAFYGIGGACRGWVAHVKGMLGGVQGV